ncbi:uncharacterized protein LOC134214399 [Armigeres subalbatus]|uniref:uncharacterized protein LOC134214399 n=1 Tax=Armigeres subalbatus TaxID=124917 RepID=UPI002ED2626C
MTYDLSLAKLVDLAIGTPKIGCFDLTALHTLLHIIVSKLGCQKSHVELLPDYKEKLNWLIESLDEEPSLHVAVEQRDNDEVFQVLAFDKNISQTEQRAPSVSNSSASQDISQRLSDLESVVSVLPNPEELRRYQSSRESLKPEETVDFLNVASRLDTIEISLGRLTTLANDLLLEFARMEKMVLPYLEGGDIAVMKTQIDNIIHLLTTQFPGFCSRRSVDPQRASKRLTINALPEDFYTRGVPTIAQLPATSSQRNNSRFSAIRNSVSTAASEQLEKEIEGIKSVLNGLIGMLPLPDASGSELVLSNSEISCEESQPAMRTNFHQKAASAIINLRSVQKEIDEIFLEKEERLVALETAHREVLDLGSKLQETINAMRENFEALESKLNLLKDECMVNMEEHFNIFGNELEKLTQDVEYLKSDTVGRVIGLEMQMEDRPDFSFFRTRVSLEKFETEIAIVKQSVEICKREFNKEELLEEMELLAAKLCEKVDRKELHTLEVKTNKKLLLLQSRLNKFLALQESIAAAGTKLKLSGNFKCISCDHEATMTAIDEVVPQTKPFRVKPHYPYEIDAGYEARTKRYCGGRQTAAALARKSRRISVEQRRLCEPSPLFEKAKTLELGLHIVSPEKPAYKIHL